MSLNVLEYFENGAARHFPGKVAIVDLDRSFTFAEVESHAKQCAALLLRRIDTINQPIAVFLPKCAEAIFADLGIAYSGNIYTNLDVKSPAQRIKNILDNIVPVLTITSRALASTLLEIGVLDSDLCFIEDIFDDALGADSLAIRACLHRIIDTDPLCIINTSGSTGVPKGVVLSHRGTIDFMDWVFGTFELDDNVRIASLSPLYFDIYTLELNLCLAKGATLVLVPDQMATFPARLMEFLEAEAISFIFWVPSIMVTISNMGLLEKYDLSAIGTVFFAGEVFPMKQLNHWRRVLRHAQFVNLYGPIEIHVDCTYFVVDREFQDEDTLPIGYPCRNTDILILNDDNQACAQGERGELCVRGSSLALGYWNDKQKTEKAFVQNPMQKHYPELIYRTGDVVYRGERDEIFLVGRKDFQIKHMGYRIDLQEIEHQVHCIAEIANACVLYNQPRKEITLFYEVLSQDATPQRIRAELSKIFPKYMVPTVFRPMEALPKNPNGKIDRNGLASLLTALR